MKIGNILSCLAFKQSKMAGASHSKNKNKKITII